MATLTEYKCPNCGGAVTFESNLQKMKCPYCDSEFDVDAIEEANRMKENMQSDDINWDMDGSEWDDEQEGLKVYVCSSCGGEIVCDETTSASQCPYCDNPITMKGAFKGQYRPNLVIPFKLDKNAAKAKYEQFVSKKSLAPPLFKDQNHIDEIKGIYVPEWLFECLVQGSVRYNATKVRSWSDRDYYYTQTSHYHVYRGGDMGFANIPVDGSSKMDDTLMESVEPFDIRGAVDFKTAYLAGYLADKYDVGYEECTGRADERVKNSFVETMRNTVHGYSSVRTEQVGVSTKQGKVKYALYPIWLLNTTYKDEKYTFAMNGQTGKMVGNLPLDKGRFFRGLLLWGSVLSAVFSAVALLVVK